MTEQPNDPIRSARDEFAGDVPLSDKVTPGELPGDVIDRYKLLQQIGEGGMGVVWMAEQKEPVRRQVALKIIKLGMDTREVVVRFEAERQALALMDHPNIARVLDGGATDSGRPFFVMELVRGVPITQFCDEARLGLRDRLELFAKVCDAVQHAHHKGVIHRDLKPSNIMVTLADGKPIPKVIDFGIAKATSVELTNKTLFTQYGNMIGTPEYMAPEQAEMSALDVDTRADIYSLGVLLYELLTGTKPFDVTKVLERGYQELLRTIREDEPAKPSTRVSTLGELAATVARARHVDASALRTRLRGEIDWIVMKALEKDRRRRYETANGFAADVHRFLAGEPVLAAPPSRTYRLRKFLRRRRRAVAALATIVVLFVAGAIGTGVGWWNAFVSNRQLTTANAELERANRDKSIALGNEQAARHAAEQAEARVVAQNRQFASIIRFHERQLAEMSPQMLGEELRKILVTEAPAQHRDALQVALAGINFTDVGISALERTILDPTLGAIDDWTVDDQSAKARLLNGAGVALNAIGRHERSLQVSRQALELLDQIDAADSDLGLTVQASLAVLLCRMGRPQDAEPFARAALAAARQNGADPIAGGQAHYALGMALLQRMQFDDALGHCRTALTTLSNGLGDASPMVMHVRNGVLSILMQANELDDAEAFARQSLGISRRHHPDHHQRVVFDRMGLVEILRRRQRLTEAESVIEGLIEDARRAFGVASQQVTDAALMLALAFLESGRADDAERVLRTELQSFTDGNGTAADRQRLETGLVRVQAQRGDLQAAEVNSARSLAAARQRGDSGMNLVTQLIQRGSTLQMRGALDEAEACFREALQHVEALGKLDAVQIAVRARLAATWRAQGKLDEAVAELRQLLEDSRDVLGPDDPNRLQILNSLAVALQGKGEFDEALPLFERVIGGYRDTYGDRHQATVFARGNYGTVLQNLGRTEEALTIYREVHEQQRAMLGANHPQALLSQLNVGGALAELERFDEALPLLDDVLEPLQQAIGEQHPNFAYALRVAGSAAFAGGDVERGEARLRRALAIARERQPDQVHGALYTLADELLQHGRPDGAEPLLVELLTMREQAWNGDCRDANCRLRLAASRGMQGRFADHVDDLERQLEALKTAPRAALKDGAHADLVRAANEIALRYYEAWGRLTPSATTDAAIERLRRLLAEQPR